MDNASYTQILNNQQILILITILLDWPSAPQIAPQS